MKSAFYTGATGLLAFQEHLDTIGNNIANTNTNGFRTQGVSFENLLYNYMYANTDTNPLTGHGVRSISTGLRTTQGTPRETGGNLDFAIVGDGFFAVNRGGEVQYTRDGAFQISLEGNRPYLVTQDGAYVLDQRGQRITLTKEKDSEVYDYADAQSKLGIYTCDNQEEMEPVAGNRFRMTQLSGPARAASEEDYRILNRYLEMSNTSLADEMTDMIAAQRAFQVSSRVLQTADEIEQTVNGLRR